jgi:phosphorylcholine metabolism protein LicD
MSYQKNLFLKVKDLLDKNEVEFFLFAGTCLGAVRDKGFISWDKEDIDLGLFSKDYDKVKQIILNSDWKIKAIWRKEISIYKDEKNGESVSYIDLFFFDEDETKLYC